MADLRAEPTAQAYEAVSSYYSRLRTLYAPSVVREAARMLDDLLDVAVRHGHDRASSDLSWLTTAAAEATSGTYRRPAVERSGAEVTAMLQVLTRALAAEGLTVTNARRRNSVAVDPVPGGPTWGAGGRGLAVALYADATWDLGANLISTRSVSIHAPVTEDGAREVAVIVNSVLRGYISDPFRD